jgi:hypothetical protein
VRGGTDRDQQQHQADDRQHHERQATAAADSPKPRSLPDYTWPLITHD